MVLIFAFALLIIPASADESANITIAPYSNDSRYFVFPDGNGTIHTVDKLEVSSRAAWFKVENSVYFLLYTRENPKKPIYLYINKTKTLKDSTYVSTKPVKIISHGWMSSHRSYINPLLVKAYLKNMDVNVIVVDWAAGSHFPYTTAVFYVPKVGQQIAKFVDWLISSGTDLKQFHLLGHSLGAHVVGIAGRNVKSGTIVRITAFDPAGPLWDKSTQRIRETDAKYVEAIHTNGGYAGLLETVGHVDYFPNGGVNMPGCKRVHLGCSHARSYEYYAEALGNKFNVQKCLDYAAIRRKTCVNTTIIKFGDEKEDPVERGIFYFTTNAYPPYNKN